MNKNNCYCVIMAGGSGTRFWPLSRTAKPKQFLDVADTGKTFIRQTFERFGKIVPQENIIVVTASRYKELVMEQIPELAENNLLLEPYSRNTAPTGRMSISRKRKPWFQALSMLCFSLLPTLHR